MIRRFVFEEVLKWLPLPVVLQLLRKSARWLPRGLKIEPKNCLEESLMAVGRQARAGRTVTLAIGVKKENGRLLAHAWTEDPEEPANEKDGFQKIGTL